MPKDKRVEVLFEPGEYRVLQDAARQRGKSVGHVIREAVAKYVVDPSEAQRQAAFERFLAIDGGPVGTPQEIKEFIGDIELLEILKSMNDPGEAQAIKALEEKIEQSPLNLEAD